MSHHHPIGTGIKHMTISFTDTIKDKKLLVTFN